MPASYAHYRFGQLIFPELPEEAKRTVQRFRQLYDVGLHGPDLFFYFQPFFHTKIGELGSRFHGMTGREFFETSAARLRETPSEGGEAYLYGVLAHFALDSVCHPMIRSAAAEGKIGHTELETEFDRYLLCQDGVEEPHTHRLCRHVRLTWGECVTVSGFYPPASAYAIRQSAVIMSLVDWTLTAKNREFLQNLFRLGGKSAAEMVMYDRPNHKCTHLIGQLEEYFRQSLERYPAMAAQLQACLRESAPLGAEFDVNFG